MRRRGMISLTTGIVAIVLTWTLLGMLGGGLTKAQAQSGDPHLVERKDEPKTGIAHVPDRLIVKFRSEFTPKISEGGMLRSGRDTVDRLLENQGVKGMQSLVRKWKGLRSEDVFGLSHIYVLQLKPGSNVAQAIQAFSNNPEVEWAEPDYIARSASQAEARLGATTPNDPLLPGQWGLDKIQAQDAWDVVTGTQTVVIAVLDSGIEQTHVDLASLLWTNPGEIAGNSTDDDNNGYVDDIHGWDFVNDDNDPSDDNGHGTQVAGIAAAATNNGAGIAGVCWNCKIMPVKVMQGSGIANYSDITAGVWYAAQKGAEVINLSLGGYGNSSALQTAIQAAVNTYGAVVVGGAGNDNLNSPFYPAAYSQVLAVAGTTSSDTKAGLSNYGTWVDVSAPALNITTTFLGGDWGPANGTSFAAPFASGLAGLLRSQHPEWSPEMVKTHIEHTTDEIDSLNPAYAGKLGTGRINAAQSVGINPHPILMLASTKVNGDPLGRPTQGEESSLEVTLGNDWNDASGVTGTLTTTDAYVNIGLGTSSFGDITAGGIGTSSPAFTFTVELAAGYNHPIPFELAVWADGGTYSTTFPLTLTTRSANEPVGGTIITNTVWTNDKTYIVNNHVGVAPGITLTIQAGTLVKFNGNYNLNVGGTLIADGTETQPIRFVSNTSGNWGRIYFDDPGVDATTNISGAYQAGNLLRWVQVDKAAQGIACNTATPYFSHVTLAGGGINCTPGATPLWVLDSMLAGGLSVSGSGQVWRNTITSGGLSLSGQSIVQENSVSLGISVGSNSLVQYNTVGGGGITGGSSSSVMYNTVTGGGVSIGGGSTASRNNIEEATGWAISTSGSVTLTYNRVVGGAKGVNLSGGIMQNNLVTNNSGLGLQINGNSTVISNTFTGNQGNTIKLVSATNLIIKGNNLEGNKGTYDIENLIPKTTYMMIPAQYNWWGTTNGVAISQRIYDYNDGDYNLGQVLYAPKADIPVQSAPPYVRSVNLEPPSPVGIEEVVFEVSFSRPMDTGVLTGLSFQNHKQDIWTVYNSSNSGLPNNRVRTIASDPDGSVWIGTFGSGAAHFDGSSWTVYNTANSGLPANDVAAITIDPDGSVWFSTWGGGAAQFDGSSWTVYNTANSGLPSNLVQFIAIGPDGSIWFGTYDGGAAHFDGSSWTVYNTANSGLPDNHACAIDVGADGSVWFGTNSGGAAHFDGSRWAAYNTSNSGLPVNDVYAIAIDLDGSVWLGTWGGGAAHFDGSSWTVYNTANSGLPTDYVHNNAIAIDPDGSVWFGTWWTGGAAHFDGSRWTVYNTSNSGLPVNEVTDIARVASYADNSVWFGIWNGGAAKLGRYPSYPVVENAVWLDDTHYQTTYAFNTLIPRDVYSLTIQGAVGMDDILITPFTSLTFTVDYAGAIGDTTPPESPNVLACGATSPDTLSASWNTHDPDSTITLYRYAIGSTPAGIDVINWTNTASTSFTRNELNLTPGQIYYVSVKARNEGGLWSEAGVSSGVVAGSGSCPISDFSAIPVSGPAPLGVQFTDHSSGTISSRQWDFGDGYTSTLQNPLHDYMATGVYTVGLFIAGPGGSDLEIKSNYITVTIPPLPPVANFTASPLSGTVPLMVTFTDLSTGAISSRLWNFGDGITSTLQHPGHQYASDGVYTVTLSVNGPGGSDQEIKPGYITVYAPVQADFSGSPTIGVAPLQVTFTNTSSGAFTSFLWNFGDGITSTLQHPNHQFASAGVYTVTLGVNGPGGSDQEVKSGYITVYAPVQANFSASPTSGVVPLQVTFTNTSSGDFTSSLWSFGDGITSTLQNPSHTYNSVGLKTVSLTMSGPGGSDGETKTNYINVTPIPVPVANFTASPLSGTVPLTVTFTDLSTGAISSRLWSFGDGITSTLQHPGHRYASARVYTPTLSVNGPGGGDQEIKPAYITVYAPVQADFSASPTSGVVPLQVTFTNTSSGSFTSSLWSFGDGITSTLQHPGHQFASDGVYTVTLSVSGPGGSDQEVKPGYITVYALVHADFSASPTSGLPPLQVNFTNTSTGDYSSLLWDFGDGGTSTLQNPSHEYMDLGMYTVTLQISGPGGSDTETKPGYIFVAKNVYLPLILRNLSSSVSGQPQAIIEGSVNYQGLMTEPQKELVSRTVTVLFTILMSAILVIQRLVI